MERSELQHSSLILKQFLKPFQWFEKKIDRTFFIFDYFCLSLYLTSHNDIAVDSTDIWTWFGRILGIPRTVVGNIRFNNWYAEQNQIARLNILIR